MKIEVTDRGMFIAACHRAIERIHAKRVEQDAQYVEAWRNHKWAWVRRRRADKLPPDYCGWVEFYPPQYGRWAENDAKRTIKALESPGTGRIYLDDEEFGAIREELKAETRRTEGGDAMNPLCPYCGEASKMVGGAKIYPHRPDLFGKKFYLCTPCRLSKIARNPLT